MDQSVTSVALDALPVLLLALSIVLLPAVVEPPVDKQPARDPARRPPR